MSKIAIIDDNLDQRETLRKAIEVYLERRGSDLEVIDIYPFVTEDFHEYSDWIDQNDILVLIFDERMHNETEDEKGPVGYRGNELVTIIRKTHKYIPVFTVTSHIHDDELQDKFGEFEYVISREDFLMDNGEKYVDIIIRSAQRYADENQRELSELGDLTKLLAIGKASEEQKERIKALQVKLQIPLVEYSDREYWLKEYEEQIEELNKFKEELENKLKEKS